MARLHYPPQTPLVLPETTFEQVVDIGDEEVALLLDNGLALYASYECLEYLLAAGAHAPVPKTLSREERLQAALALRDITPPRQFAETLVREAGLLPEVLKPEPLAPTLPAHLLHAAAPARLAYMSQGEEAGRDGLMPTTEELESFCIHAKQGHAGAVDYLCRLGMPQLFEALPFLADAPRLRSRISHLRHEASVRGREEMATMPMELSDFAAGVSPRQGTSLQGSAVRDLGEVFNELSVEPDRPGMVRQDLIEDAPHLAEEMRRSGRFAPDPAVRAQAIIDAAPPRGPAPRRGQ